MKSPDCTILVNSCDSYSDTWNPFFSLFKKFWPDCPFEIILNTESLHYFHDGLDVKCLSLYEKGSEVPYGERLIRHIKIAKTKYLLMLTEDCFIRRPVDVGWIDRLIVAMENDADIAAFTFEETEDPSNIDDGRYDGFVLHHQFSDYKVTLQGALWRTETLLSLLKPHENPWQLELMGSIRALDLKDKFYILKSQHNTPIDYGKTMGLTWGIIRGKWVKSTVSFFMDNDIKIDYEKRGLFTQEDLEKNSSAKSGFRFMIRSLGIKRTLDVVVWKYSAAIRRRIGLHTDGSYFEHRRRLEGRTP